MKNHFSFIFALTTLVGIAMHFSSCSKNAIEPDRVQLQDVCDESSAMANFSVALSRALYSHTEVRVFLKAEALKRFDNDDEVFYPFVKNVEIENLGTFRDILIRELSSVEMMDQIEQELPTLTILVSDASWFDPEGFCLSRWDTSDPCVAVTYREQDGICRRLFGDGYLLGEIETGTIPGGPVLIVKTSERVVASPSTKGGVMEYSFLFDEFDASKNQAETKGRYSWEWLNESQVNSPDYVSGSVLNSINPDIVKAYDLFKNDSYACHNDYIFYGMTSNDTKGKLRTDVRNKIYRIKLSARSFPVVFDDSSLDTNYQDLWETRDNGQGYAAEPSRETVYSKLWADGRLEIIFTFLVGENGDSGVVMPLSVRARDLYTVKNDVVMKEQWKATVLVWSIGWNYTFGSFSKDFRRRDDTTLTEKWYYLPYPIEIPNWDLLSRSSYSIKVEESDSGATHVDEITVSVKQANKSSIGTEASAGIPGKILTNANVKLSLGWNKENEETRTEKQTITWTESSDALGTPIISFNDKVIESKVGDNYYLHSYGSGDFLFTILPYRY